ncbi:MAG: molybdenum cofactor guanylyltransferase MobA [Burkholderiales bacterium]
MTITGLILAGGRSTRMGEIDKGLQAVDDMPMVRHVLTRLAPQVDRLIISANRNLPNYQSLGVPVWPDDMPGFAGPLAGFQTGLLHCDTTYLVSVPCDSPFLPTYLVEKLLTMLTAADADLAFAVTGAGAARRLQPVFCLMKASLLPDLTQFLQQGGRKVDAWYKTLNTVEVHFSNESAFCNINTPEDLQRLNTRPI